MAPGGKWLARAVGLGPTERHIRNRKAGFPTDYHGECQLRRVYPPRRWRGEPGVDYPTRPNVWYKNRPNGAPPICDCGYVPSHCRCGKIRRGRGPMEIAPFRPPPHRTPLYMNGGCRRPECRGRMPHIHRGGRYNPSMFDEDDDDEDDDDLASWASDPFGPHSRYDPYDDEYDEFDDDDDRSDWGRRSYERRRPRHYGHGRYDPQYAGHAMHGHHGHGHGGMHHMPHRGHSRDYRRYHDDVRSQTTGSTESW